MGISQAVQLTLAFFLNLVAARYLGDTDFGKYAVASVLSFFVFMFDDLGMSTYATREMARNPEQGPALLANGLGAKLLLIPLPLIFVGIYVSLFSFPADKIIAILLFAGFGIFYSFNQLFNAVYRAHERLEYEMLVYILEKGFIAVIAIILLMQGKGLITFCAIFLLGGFFSFSVNVAVIRKRFIRHWPRFSRQGMAALLRASFVLGLFWFLTNIHERIDVLMLTVMKTDAMVGWYSAAYKLIVVANVVPMILMTATLPRISRVDKGNPAEVERIFHLGFKFLMYAAMPMTAGTLFLADRMIPFVFGVDFLPGAAALRILIFASAVDFFSVFFAGFLIAWDRQNRLTVLQGIAIVVNVILNLILIPRFGFIGAAAATVISRGVVFGACTCFVLERFRKIRFLPVIQGAAATLVMALFLWIWRGGLLPAIGIAVLIFGVTLYLAGGFHIEEIMLMKKTVNSQ